MQVHLKIPTYDGRNILVYPRMEENCIVAYTCIDIIKTIFTSHNHQNICISINYWVYINSQGTEGIHALTN